MRDDIDVRLIDYWLDRIEKEKSLYLDWNELKFLFMHKDTWPDWFKEKMGYDRQSKL